MSSLLRLSPLWLNFPYVCPSAGQQPDAPAPHPRVCRGDAYAAGNASGGAADGPAQGAAEGQVFRLRPGRPRWVA